MNAVPEPYELVVVDRDLATQKAWCEMHDGWIQYRAEVPLEQLAVGRQFVKQEMFEALFEHRTRIDALLVRWLAARDVPIEFRGGPRAGHRNLIRANRDGWPWMEEIRVPNLAAVTFAREPETEIVDGSTWPVAVYVRAGMPDVGVAVWPYEYRA